MVCRRANHGLLHCTALHCGAARRVLLEKHDDRRSDLVFSDLGRSTGGRLHAPFLALRSMV